MELICPVCKKWTEIPERDVLPGRQCRCRECWSILRVESSRPLRVRPASSGSQTPEEIASTTSQGGENG